MLLEVMDFVMERPVVVALVLVMIYRFIKARRPLPDYGGNITVVRTAGEWSALQARRTMSTGSPAHSPPCVRPRQERSAAEKRVICIDAYANWCPPCRAAAPVFARLSEEYLAVTFAKVNVDEAGDVAAALGVTAMPTFKLFRGRTELASVRGFDQKRLRALLKEHGDGAKRD